MWKYLNRHEKFMNEKLSGDLSVEELIELRNYHENQIGYMQHERFIHLIVTLFIALFLMLALGFSMVIRTFTGTALSLILLVLESAYLIHYFHLENGVQRWYGISNEIDYRLGKVDIKLRKS